MKYLKYPRINRRTGLQDGWRWSFYIYSQEKQRNEKVRLQKIPQHIRDSQIEEEVKTWCRLQDDVELSRRRRFEEAMVWRERHKKKEELLNSFIERIKISAPNSWQTSACHLNNYVFNFFLNKRQLDNMNDWELRYGEFKEWLKTIKPLKGSQPCLAINTQNHIITALNQFLAYMEEVNQIARFKRCEVYPDKNLPKVSAEDLIDNSELPVLLAALSEIRLQSAKMYRTARFTGLRSQELVGLSLPFISQGKISDGPKSDKIHRALEKCGLGSYFGYICLESQPALNVVRAKKSYFDEDLRQHVVSGTVPRAPLKCRDEINPKWYRYIPVFDRDTWNVLVDAHSEAMAKFENKIYGDNPRDYLLFDDIAAGTYYMDVCKAFEVTKLRYRCPHKLRHTFLTWFYDQVDEDLFLAEKVAGHRDKKTIEIYSHIREQIGRERQFAQQRMMPLKKVS